MSGTSVRVLITGGLGYVGGRVADYLRQSQGHFNLRLLSRRPMRAWPEWAHAHEVIQGDVLEPPVLERAMAEVDVVLHLAALNEIDSARDPQRALLVNAGGTARVIEAAATAGARRLIYMSTFHIYGPCAQFNITEGVVPRPTHPYAISHRAAEDFVLAARDQGKLATLVLRLSNGYGCPRDPGVNRWTLVFTDLCRQAVEKHRLILRSSGRQKRDFISLEDVARATVHFLNLPDDQWGNGLFNLGGDCPLSILEIAQAIADEYERSYGTRMEIEAGDAPDPAGFEQVRYDIAKLKATGFLHEGDLRKEIRATFRMCEQVCGVRPASR
jgi:UDP-glucose 4-epimerase